MKAQIAQEQVIFFHRLGCILWFLGLTSLAHQAWDKAEAADAEMWQAIFYRE